MITASFRAESSSFASPIGKVRWIQIRFIRREESINNFEATGKLLEHDDLFGNHIYYNYAIAGDGTQNVLLDFIEDS